VQQILETQLAHARNDKDEHRAHGGASEPENDLNVVDGNRDEIAKERARQHHHKACPERFLQCWFARNVTPERPQRQTRRKHHQRKRKTNHQTITNFAQFN